MNYRAYDVTISKPSTANAQKAQTWQTKNNIVNTSNEDIIETAPPQPPRNRLRKSNTGSKFEGSPITSSALSLTIIPESF